MPLPARPPEPTTPCPHCDSPVRLQDAACPVCHYPRLPQQLPPSPFAEPDAQMPQGGKLYAESVHFMQRLRGVRMGLLARWISLMILYPVAHVLLLLLLPDNESVVYEMNRAPLGFLFLNGIMLLLIGIGAFLLFQHIRRRPAQAVALWMALEAVLLILALNSLSVYLNFDVPLEGPDVLLLVQAAAVVFTQIALATQMGHLQRLQQLQRLAEREDDGGLFGASD